MITYRVAALPQDIPESEDHGGFPLGQQQLDPLLSLVSQESLTGRSHGVLVHRLPGLPCHPPDTLRLKVKVREKRPVDGNGDSPSPFLTF